MARGGGGRVLLVICHTSDLTRRVNKQTR